MQTTVKRQNDQSKLAQCWQTCRRKEQKTRKDRGNDSATSEDTQRHQATQECPPSKRQTTGRHPRAPGHAVSAFQQPNNSKEESRDNTWTKEMRQIQMTVKRHNDRNKLASWQTQTRRTKDKQGELTSLLQIEKEGRLQKFRKCVDRHCQIRDDKEDELLV